MIDPALLAILVCPVSRTSLRLEGDALISDAAGLAYPIRDGVPIMVPELARQIAEDTRVPETPNASTRAGVTKRGD